MRYFIKDSFCIVALSLQVCAQTEASIYVYINADLRQSLKQIRVISPARFLHLPMPRSVFKGIFPSHLCVISKQTQVHKYHIYIWDTGHLWVWNNSPLITPRIRHVMPPKPRLATPPNTRLPSDKPWLIISLSHHTEDVIGMRWTWSRVSDFWRDRTRLRELRGGRRIRGRWKAVPCSEHAIWRTCKDYAWCHFLSSARFVRRLIGKLKEKANAAVTGRRCP